MKPNAFSTVELIRNTVNTKQILQIEHTIGVTFTYITIQVKNKIFAVQCPTYQRQTFASSFRTYTNQPVEFLFPPVTSVELAKLFAPESYNSRRISIRKITSILRHSSSRPKRAES